MPKHHRIGLIFFLLILINLMPLILAQTESQMDDDENDLPTQTSLSKITTYVPDFSSDLENKKITGPAILLVISIILLLIFFLKLRKMHKEIEGFWDLANL